MVLKNLRSKFKTCEEREREKKVAVFSLKAQATCHFASFGGGVFDIAVSSLTCVGLFVTP